MSDCRHGGLWLAPLWGFLFSSFLIIYSLVGVTVEFKYKSSAKRDYADAGSREEALGRPKLFRK